jgi:hypothetical protein
MGLLSSATPFDATPDRFGTVLSLTLEFHLIAGCEVACRPVVEAL